MRDIVFAMLMAVASLFIFRRPWWGIVLLAWLSYMNAQRLCFGFAVSFPFFFIVIGCTFVALLISREPKNLPWSPALCLLLGLVIWMNVSFLFALNPPGALWEWNRTMKTMVFLSLSLIVMTNKIRLELLLWTIALSFGFYGVKGGLSTIIHGGVNTIQGPENTLIGDNNHLAVALSMSIPLMRYLQLQTNNKWLRFAISGMMILTCFAVLGTYSRAGFLSLGVVAFVMWLKSRRKLLLAFAIPVVAAALLCFMPQRWTDRMNTIKSYDEDASTQGRFNAWRFAYNLANDRPLIGGGFDSFTPELFRRYAPNPDNHHAAHSIYFQMLGDNGYPGLLLFLAFGVSTWMTASWVRRQARMLEELTWAADMSSMLQTALAVYAVGGASLSLAYFDLPYHLATMVLMCRAITVKRVRQQHFEYEPETILMSRTRIDGAWKGMVF